MVRGSRPIRGRRARGSLRLRRGRHGQRCWTEQGKSWQRQPTCNSSNSRDGRSSPEQLSITSRSDGKQAFSPSESGHMREELPGITCKNNDLLGPVRSSPSSNRKLLLQLQPVPVLYKLRATRTFHSPSPAAASLILPPPLPSSSSSRPPLVPSPDRHHDSLHPSSSDGDTTGKPVRSRITSLHHTSSFADKWLVSHTASHQQIHS